MEAFVSCAAGLLTACCAAGLLGACGVPSRRDGGAGTSRRALVSAATDRVRALGGFVIECGMPFDAVEALATEVRMLALGERRPFESVERELAVGGTAGASAASAVLLALLAASPVGLVFGAALPGAWLGMRAVRRARVTKKHVEEAMPEAFGALSIALESGHSLAQAMRFVGRHADEPIRSEFMRVSFSIDCGIPASEALDAMLERMPAPCLDLVTLALKVSQRTGAPLKDLLAEAAAVAGERIELARALDVKTAQVRMSARLVAGMPLAMIAVLSLISVDFRAGAATPTGIASIALAIALDVVAWAVIKRVMEVRL